VVNSTGGTSGAYGSGALVTRENGGTAGVTNQGGHSVFTSSVAPAKSHAAHRAHAGSRSAARAVAPSPRTANGDVWSGFAPASKSPVTAAAATSAAQGGGLSTQVLAGMVILGLGLTGLCGGAFAFTASRRRKTATARSRSDS
jgi:hypothetical protein